METKKYSKTEIIIQSIIFVISGILFYGCLVHASRFHNDILNRKQQLVSNMSVLCINDNELLLEWNDGQYSVQHQYCSTCGKKTEDTGVISSKKCLKCNSTVDSKSKYCPFCGTETKQISAKDWLKENDFSTFEEYGSFYKKSFSDKYLPTFESLAGLFICGVLIVNSGDISEKINKKLTKRKNEKGAA